MMRGSRRCVGSMGFASCGRLTAISVVLPDLPSSIRWSKGSVQAERPNDRSTASRVAGGREQRFAADRFGRQAGQLHAELGFGGAVERMAQPRRGPALQLPAIAVLLLEEDRR